MSRVALLMLHCRQSCYLPRVNGKSRGTIPRTVFSNNSRGTNNSNDNNENIQHLVQGNYAA